MFWLGPPSAQGAGTRWQNKPRIQMLATSYFDLICDELTDSMGDSIAIASGTAALRLLRWVARAYLQKNKKEMGKPLYAGFETRFGWDARHLRCWEQNTSQIQILRHFEKKGSDAALWASAYTGSGTVDVEELLLVAPLVSSVSSLYCRARA